MRLQVPFCELAPLTLRQEQILTRGVHIACVPRNHNTSFSAAFRCFIPRLSLGSV
jgi:hypothetical protein